MWAYRWQPLGYLKESVQVYMVSFTSSVSPPPFLFHSDTFMAALSCMGSSWSSFLNCDISHQAKHPEMCRVYWNESRPFLRNWRHLLSCHWLGKQSSGLLPCVLPVDVPLVLNTRSSPNFKKIKESKIFYPSEQRIFQSPLTIPPPWGHDLTGEQTEERRLWLPAHGTWRRSWRQKGRHSACLRGSHWQRKRKWWELQDAERMADLGRKGMLRGVSGVHPQGSLPGQEGSSWAWCRV